MAVLSSLPPTPVAMLRTPSEENLRREAHLELANARLEGASVGQYRYYQGHLSVEEYVSKGHVCLLVAVCLLESLQQVWRRHVPMWRRLGNRGRQRLREWLVSASKG